MEIAKKGKKFWTIIVAIAVVILVVIGFVGNKIAESKQANKQVVNLENDLEKERAKIEELKTNLEKKNGQIAELEAKVEEAEPWFEMSKKEQERKIAEEKKKQQEEKAAAKKKAEEEEKARLAAEEEERKKQEEKEKKGYETGITFDQLARTPDDYKGKKVKFSGRVVQVIEGDGLTVQLRIAVNDDHDKIIYVEYDSSIVDSRILEDDQITIMGLSAGLLTYESTLGGDITIPAIVVDKIEQ
ncbi:toxin regulator [Lentibacillus sp. Marseille-P4043]|uniref:toxin regulator n=1 Tax=Lentibacillus sp. Marseille-P4043 TaxID=2040293 RepID=UPI001F1A61D0|nr:toxin regulator [Lentibacillus sp. Marseille-P4043]